MWSVQLPNPTTPERSRRTLGLKAQVSTAFLERGLNAPALDETRHDIAGLIARTRREEGPWRLLGITATDQNPSEWQHRLTAAIPQGRAATDLQPPHAAIVPTHAQGLPAGRRIVQALGQS